MATQSDIDQLLVKMAKERSRLLALLSDLSEADAEWAPRDAEGEGQWSAKQQASHLTEMETAYRAWVEEGLRTADPDVTDVRGGAVTIPLEAAHQHTMRELIDVMKLERSRTLELLGRMRPEDFERTATHSWFGTLTLMQWLRSYYRHDRMHIDQVEGREPDYKPHFAAGREPDQRR